MQVRVSKNHSKLRVRSFAGAAFAVALCMALLPAAAFADEQGTDGASGGDVAAIEKVSEESAVLDKSSEGDDNVITKAPSKGQPALTEQNSAAGSEEGCQKE